MTIQQSAMENDLKMVLPINIVMWHSYLSLPKGIYGDVLGDFGFEQKYQGRNKGS